MRISILVDDPQSWIVTWAVTLKNTLAREGHSVILVHDQKEIVEGDIAFFLGCIRIIKPQILDRSKNNLVVHPSDLPKGRGFSPLAWQILEGKNDIPICLFEAVPEMDAGVIYLRDTINLNGYELNEEIKHLQGEKTLDMCLRFVHEYHSISPEVQEGASTFYPRRSSEDSELDIHKPLLELFPLLRVVDNSRYPAFFYLNNHKYVIRIERENEHPSK